MQENMREIDVKPCGVYVRTDDGARIIEVGSDAFLDDLNGWIRIDEGDGDRFTHAQGNYLDGPLADERGVYRYKLKDGGVVCRTREEMDADAAAIVVPMSETDAALVELAGMMADVMTGMAELAALMAGGE